MPRLATKRLRALRVLLEEVSYSDVVREAQEVAELALKALLRGFGIDPPRQHDVGALVIEYAGRFPPGVAAQVDRLAAISKRLRKERVVAFYGDVDFIPTAEYSLDDGSRALAEAESMVTVVRSAMQV